MRRRGQSPIAEHGHEHPPRDGRAGPRRLARARGCERPPLLVARRVGLDELGATTRVTWSSVWNGAQKIVAIAGVRRRIY